MSHHSDCIQDKRFIILFKKIFRLIIDAYNRDDFISDHFYRTTPKGCKYFFIFI